MKKIFITVFIALLSFNLCFSIISQSEEPKSLHEIAVIISKYDLSFDDSLRSLNLAMSKIESSAKKFGLLQDNVPGINIITGEKYGSYFTEEDSDASFWNKVLDFFSMFIMAFGNIFALFYVLVEGIFILIPTLLTFILEFLTVFSNTLRIILRLIS